ncbi:MAG: hypothetical protein Q7T08_10660 [Devosia sp.]|nr:hypothetical protein [Devosia sp.]
MPRSDHETEAVEPDDVPHATMLSQTNIFRFRRLKWGDPDLKLSSSDRSASRIEAIDIVLGLIIVLAVVYIAFQLAR